MVSLNSFISSENLSRVESFVEELLSEDHIFSAESDLCESNQDLAEAKQDEYHRLMSALDQLKRALIQHMPALFAEAQSKPQLQLTLQHLLSMFLCELS